ncbi:hypothetical protein CDAR_315961 [Caerostris darwini]|uniref:Uncharacterized protein n=1 Tax=Caerostris darwini TaxID=1538125 RepID=A0AAV4MC87_9ARAC|nr:hypothetical protein CDAR_315961 [Caerostris darwini]
MRKGAFVSIEDSGTRIPLFFSFTREKKIKDDFSARSKQKGNMLLGFDVGDITIIVCVQHPGNPCHFPRIITASHIRRTTPHKSPRVENHNRHQYPSPQRKALRYAKSRRSLEMPNNFARRVVFSETEIQDTFRT